MERILELLRALNIVDDEGEWIIEARENKQLTLRRLIGIEKETSQVNSNHWDEEEWEELLLGQIRNYASIQLRPTKTQGTA